jgi:hypothetical protein
MRKRQIYKQTDKQTEIMKHLLDKENDSRDKQHERGKEKHVCWWIYEKRERKKERKRGKGKTFIWMRERERERERERVFYQDFLLRCPIPTLC